MVASKIKGTVVDKDSGKALVGANVFLLEVKLDKPTDMGSASDFDGNYIIDKHPEAENTWVIGGGSGHGFKLGPALGEFVADRVIGNKGIDPFFALSRFNKDLDKKTQFNPQ